MRRLMSLREARGEEKEDDGEWSSNEAPEKLESGEIDLLEHLLQQAHNAPPSRGTTDPPGFCLDLSSDFLAYSRRGLVPSRTAPYLNAFLQALLPCSPLMHLFAQLSQHALSKQRPAYACLVQIAFQFFGANRTSCRGIEERFTTCPVAASLHTDASQAARVSLPPFEASLFTEPLLRRFERGKPATNPPPGRGQADMLARFVHFVLGQLHDECKWPTLSPITGYCEDSPVTRIFGGLLQRSRGPQNGRASPGGLMETDCSNVEAFLALHLDLVTDVCASVAEAMQYLLRPADSCFLRLPPFLLIHLQRFRAIDGVATKVSKHCYIDMCLELEEAANCTVRAVCYELCSFVCHYGEVPESGSYKALARHGVSQKLSTSATTIAHCVGGTVAAPSAGEWYVFDDTAVRVKLGEELGAVVQCEGYHACFLMYRRDDTKTINVRPHAV